uniref:Uncharacterized protein n=2 Tax=viral metagenome TaxID=1070528 RepID=A0A6M3JV80_9ZZZZ
MEERRIGYQEILSKLDENTKKTDEILVILNGNGSVGLCAKVNVLWGNLSPKLDEIVKKVTENRILISDIDSKTITLEDRINEINKKDIKKSDCKKLKLDKTLTFLIGIALLLVGALIKSCWG